MGSSRLVSGVMSAGALLLLAACSTFADPETATIVAQPKTPPVKTVTSFTPALRCMDDLFARYGKSDIIITSAGLPDATGLIQAGTKEMMISAISKMSVKSNAFRFVDYDPTQIGVQDLHNLIGIRTDLGFDVPRYYIRGAITQLDSGVTADSAGGGVAYGGVAVGAATDRIASVIGMDLNMGDMITRQILPGISATNSITVTRSGTGGDFDGLIGKVGIFFELSMDRSEGTHQSVRTLVELSLIELMGKLTKVPYWRCLDIPATNPAIMAEAREWFDSTPETDIVAAVQTALIGAGYYSGAPSGRLDDATRRAISRFQAEADLIPNGRLDFAVFFDMLQRDLLVIEDKLDAGAQLFPASTDDSGAAAPLGQQVAFGLTTNKGRTPTFGIGEEITVSFQPQEGAYMYCYYLDGAGLISRIFPNRFQPNAYVNPGKRIDIPGSHGKFSILAEFPGAEEAVDCVASKRELGIGLPPWMMEQDLRPIPNVTSLDRVLGEFQRIDPVGLTHVRLPIRIAG
ncbi:MAG: DUF4384 domain-containing protein [Alphaproteobacteria bacterium]|nr:DUF4384 domain-containing protein [Alphaproteobacteria bacterium]